MHHKLCSNFIFIPKYTVDYYNVDRTQYNLIHKSYWQSLIKSKNFVVTINLIFFFKKLYFK